MKCANGVCEIDILSPDIGGFDKAQVEAKIYINWLMFEADRDRAN